MRPMQKTLTNFQTILSRWRMSWQNALNSDALVTCFLERNSAQNASRRSRANRIDEFIARNGKDLPLLDKTELQMVTAKWTMMTPSYTTVGGPKSEWVPNTETASGLSK